MVFAHIAITILLHLGFDVPQRFLRWAYKPAKLTSDIRFISPRTVLVNRASGELQMKMPVMNLLPFNVEMSHIEFDIMLQRSHRMAHIHYSRKVMLERQNETNIEIPVTKLDDAQLQMLGNADSTLWFFGEADLETSFGTKFTVHIKELKCAPILTSSAG